jgi:hypothetical protein
MYIATLTHLFAVGEGAKLGAAAAPKTTAK